MVVGTLLAREAKRRIVVLLLLHVQHVMGQERLPSNALRNLLRKRNNAEMKLGNICDIQGAHIIADDLIIAARDDQEHDDILHRVVTRARDKGVKFNSEKVQFKIGQVEHMSNLVSSDGLKPGPKKVEAIMNMPKPTDVNSLQRLLGLIKYLA